MDELSDGTGLSAGTSGGLFNTIESRDVSISRRSYIHLIFHYSKKNISRHGGKYLLTSFWLRCRRFGIKRSLLERPPFEILFVSSTCYTPLMTLLARRLRLIAFQSFRLTSHTTYRRSQSVNQIPNYPSYQNQDKKTPHRMNIPLRLLDCLGLVIPVPFLLGLEDLGAVVDFRFGGGGAGGLAAGFMTGELRKAVGDGIVIVSISGTSCMQPLIYTKKERINNNINNTNVEVS